MSKNKASNLNEHISDFIFNKKEDSSESKLYTLEEQLVNFSNEVLGIKVMSVALPISYQCQQKTETQLIDWLSNTVQSRYTSAYELCLKYENKFKFKSDQKQPYSNFK